VIGFLETARCPVSQGNVGILMLCHAVKAVCGASFSIISLPPGNVELDTAAEIFRSEIVRFG
jgi:hypothetical protein